MRSQRFDGWSVARLCSMIAGVLLASAVLAAPSVLRRDALVPLTVVLEAGGEDEAKALTVLKRIGEPWDNVYAAPLLDLFPTTVP